MTDDYTRPDTDLFPDEPTGSVMTEEVDAILGETIDGRYEVLSRLGQGGMGFVFEAKDLALGGQSVVLKTLRPQLVKDERSAQRFTREAMASARIDHPHVIKVTGYGVNEDHGAYYVMERLVGMDLGAVLNNATAPLSAQRTLHIAKQVASALAAAHRQGIVHRDLKPENIFLTTKDGDEDYVKVLDFGLARLLDATKLTETGAVIGTPRYMSPEQCRGQPVDPRADLYSLGAVMMEMLTGIQPYTGIGTFELLGKKMFEDVVAPSALEPPVHIDPRLEAFLMRLLSREPEPRPVDGGQLLEIVERLERDLRVPAQGFAPPGAVRQTHAPAESEAPPTRAGRSPLLLIGGALAALGIAAGLAAVAWVLLGS